MPRTGKFYDELETRSADQRQEDQLQQLQAQIAHAKENSTYFGDLLKDVSPSDIQSLEDLASLPVTRKSDLVATQKSAPPLGGLNGVEIGRCQTCLCPLGLFLNQLRMLMIIFAWDVPCGQPDFAPVI